MKNLKRILAFILSLLILVATLPAFSTLAAESNFRYGRDLLGNMQNGENMQKVYDLFVNDCSNAKSEITFNLKDYDLIGEELKTIFNLFYYDYPEYFWLNGAYSYQISSNVVNFEPKYTITGTELSTAKTAYNAKVNELINGISGSDYEKSKTLHDRLINTVTYESTDNDQNAYGALVEGKAVCNGYARAYQHLLNKVGIPAWYVRGSSVNPQTQSPENHAWNVVKIDGKWYYTDVTWDDQGENIFYAYFNVTEAQIKADHTFDTEFTGYLSGITATSTDANYYVKENLVFQNYDRSKLINAVKANNYCVQLYVSGNIETFLTDFNNDLQGLATQLGHISGCNYVCLGNALIITFTRTDVNPTWKQDNVGWWYDYGDGTYAKGWVQIGGLWYYFNESGYLQTGWLNIDGKWYYTNADGAMMTGWQSIDNFWYYFNAGGDMVTGWKIIENQKYLFDYKGRMVDGVHKFVIDVSRHQGDIDWDKVVSAGVDAVILRSSYATDVDRNFNKYIADLNEKGIAYGTYTYNTATTVEDAKVQAEKVVEILKNANANPTMPVFVDIEQDGGKCDLVAIAKTYAAVFIENGYKPGIYANLNYWKNYLNDDSLNAYYKWIARYGIDNGYPSVTFSPEEKVENYMMWQYTDKGIVDGISTEVDLDALFDWYIKTDGWHLVDGEFYYYQNGYVLHGWAFISGTYYYFNTNGVMLKNWQLINGDWYYFDGSGAMLSNCYVGDYWLTSSGAMTTDKWQLDAGGWWYSYAAGGYATGWTVIGGNWYYFNASGYMQTGWQLIGNAWYYFNAGGDMVSNAWVGGYYLSASGAMTTPSWQLDGNGWWYSYGDGTYAANQWLLIDGTWYYFNAAGYVSTGWQVIGGSWYYFLSGGQMVTDWQIIGGSWYYFYADGSMAANTWIGNYYLTASGAMA